MADGTSGFAGDAAGMIQTRQRLSKILNSFLTSCAKTADILWRNMLTEPKPGRMRYKPSFLPFLYKDGKTSALTSG
jgi:hypothetical protein